MDPRQLSRLADVESRQPVYNGAPPSAIQPLKQRLTQLRSEFAAAPETERGRLATAITHVEALIERLERGNGTRRA